MSRERLRQRLEKLENDRFITADGVEAVFITVVDNSKEGAGRPLEVLGWRYQRHGADDVVTMREPGEADDRLRERHMADVRPLLPRGSVPMFLPINPE
ncbi:hypothetical protein QLQ85_19730 [Halomonas sp. M4R5S39]|uniref:hypothetical protein n=1 Tax=Halomonas kalidii TaxID=3043293 RepID=UPI0024A89D60|nr:hypothetical protein [Halomonas kalidii]MDI5987020.1 hypothetical protein [Halomonas kalidii]